MPEIAEIARIVHFIRKHLVGKTLAAVTATDDPIVYGKVGTSAAEFEKHMTGKTIVGAGQQGKYFWMEMSSPPHPVMHFGMAGWLKIRDEETYYYRKKEGDKTDEDWPPRYCKFNLETQGTPKVEAAFVDFRRLGRIRLVQCDAKDLRKTTPLVENGPDPVQDKDLVTVEWLRAKVKSKRVPIKALLLDQANISGIGNWVGDEIMYDARMHPEQYSNTLSDDQIKQLHKSIHYVCGTAVGLLGDSEQFPETWLFKHRWGKAKKDSTKTLPNGEKIIFMTVGGRTSAVVPSRQKKTGEVAGDVGGNDEGGKEEKKKAAGKKRKVDIEPEVEEVLEEDAKPTPKTKKTKVEPTSSSSSAAKANPAMKKKTPVKKEDDDEVEPKLNGTPSVKKAAGKTNGVKKESKNTAPAAKAKASVKAEEDTGKRRSGRLGR